MTTSEPTTDNVIQQVEGHPTLIEAAKVAQEAADAILNRVEPTPGEIVRALREVVSDPMFRIHEIAKRCRVAADRLESQDREIERLQKTINRQDAVCYALTARAEQAEKERDELKETVIDYELAERGF